MRKWLKILGAIVVTMASAQTKAQSITSNVKGKIGELTAPAKAYLMYTDNAVRKMDSVIIDHGEYTFKGVAEDPGPATLFINSKGTGFISNDIGFLNFYLEKGNISIISSDSSSIQNATISAGPLNKEYDKLKLSYKEVDAKLDKLNDVFASAPAEKQKSNSFRDSIIKETFRIEDERKLAALAFIKTHRSSMVSLTALYDYGGYYPDSRLVEPAFNLLSANVQQSKAGLSYAAEIATMKKTAIGAIAPDFTLADTLGKAISLHDFKGQYVLIDFWASWCAPCRAETPNLLKAFNLYKKQNFTVLSVSSDVNKNKENWLNAIRTDHMIWPQAVDLNKGPKNDASTFYNVNNIPQNFLIGPDGKILNKNLRGEDLLSALQKIFN